MLTLLGFSIQLIEPIVLLLDVPIK